MRMSGLGQGEDDLGESSDVALLEEPQPRQRPPFDGSTERVVGQHWPSCQFIDVLKKYAVCVWDDMRVLGAGHDPTSRNADF